MVFKKKIIVTGGAGFVGTNLIKLLLKKTNYEIISIDDYSSGSKKNHVTGNIVVDMSKGGPECGSQRQKCRAAHSTEA